MAIPKTKTYDHLGGLVNVETDSESVKDPESGIPVKQDIDELKKKAKEQGDSLNDLGLKIVNIFGTAENLTEIL